MVGRIVAFCVSALLLSSTVQAADLSLAWDANPEADIAGYKLHYGSQSGAYAAVIDVGASTTCTVSGLTEGQNYYFAVQAYNTKGLLSPLSSEVTGIPPDRMAPVVTISLPAPGAIVSGTIQIVAVATDNVRVAGVTLLIDGVPTGVEATAEPYRFTWNTTTLADGPHSVSAIARDAAGNTASSPVVLVDVRNAVMPGSPLVAAYGFDEGGGIVASDASGRGQHGSISGATWAAGRFGRALAFDGIDDWVTVASTDALGLTGALTVEAWVYPTATGGWRTIAFKEAPAEVWRHTYGLYSTFGTEGPGGHVLLADYVNVHDAAALPLDRWSHLAMTYDGAAVKFFLNGVERLTAPGAGPLQISDGALRIGGNAMWGDFFEGRIDELRIYNRALTSSDIQRDMGTPVTGWLAAAYGFEEGSGLQARDDSGRALHGTISGASWTTGRFGRALRFDGINDWVVVPDSEWLHLSTAMTIEAWVYPTALGGWRTVLLKEFGSWYSYGLYADGTGGPAAHAFLTTSDTSTPARRTLPLNAWTHLAATFDGTKLRLFIDGQLASETFPVTGTIRPSTGLLRIGGNSIWGEYFSGKIDEVRIYSRALTAAEIRADMVRAVKP